MYAVCMLLSVPPNWQIKAGLNGARVGSALGAVVGFTVGPIRQKKRIIDTYVLTNGSSTYQM